MIKILNGKIETVNIGKHSDFNKPKRILCDLDGTLLGSNQKYVEFKFVKNAVHSMSKTIGYKKSFLAIRAIKSALEDRSFGLKTNHQFAIKIFQKISQLDFLSATTLFEYTLNHTFPSLENDFYSIGEGVNFLHWAKDNYKLTLATDPMWPENLVHKRMEWGKLDPSIFDWITHSENMRSCKPHLSYYHEILNHHQIEGKETLLIGNDFQKDYPAIAAGIPVFIINSSPLPLSFLLRKAKHLKVADTPCWVGNFNELKSCLKISKPVSNLPTSDIQDCVNHDNFTRV